MQELLQYPMVRGAIAGVLAAAVVDYGAFRSWKSFDDAAAYDWKTASWRWLQGAIVGTLTGVGLVL
jgi:hypothetical protein